MIKLRNYYTQRYYDIKIPIIKQFKKHLSMNLIKINDLNDPALAVYKDLSEIQLKRFYEPAEGLFICESPKVLRRALDAGYKPVSLLTDPKYLKSDEQDVIERCMQAATTSVGKEHGSADPAADGFPVYTAPSDTLSKLTGYHLTNGMLCAMQRRPLPSAEDLLTAIISSSEGSTANASKRVRIAVLEDIENPTNVGAIFRSAAAMGIDAVLLTAGCSDPFYRRAARVSVGTVFQIPWTWISGADSIQVPVDVTADTRQNKGSGTTIYIERLHSLGFHVAALALSDDSVSIDAPALKKEEKLAILLGNEGNGLHKETIACSDYVVKIPMPEGIDSLNVAAASAVAFWELRK